MLVLGERTNSAACLLCLIPAIVRSVLFCKVRVMGLTVWPLVALPKHDLILRTAGLW